MHHDAIAQAGGQNCEPLYVRLPIYRPRGGRHLSMSAFFSLSPSAASSIAPSSTPQVADNFVGVARSLLDLLTSFGARYDRTHCAVFDHFALDPTVLFLIILLSILLHFLLHHHCPSSRWSNARPSERPLRDRTCSQPSYWLCSRYSSSGSCRCSTSTTACSGLTARLRARLNGPSPFANSFSLI